MDQPGTGTASEITRTIDIVLTRQANATVYAAGQIVGGTSAALSQLKFPLARQGGGSGKIKALVAIDESVPATKADLELWLFDTAPAAQADAAAFGPTNAELEALLGVIPIPVASWKTTANGVAQHVVLNGQIPFNCITGNNSDAIIYGILVVRNAYTPANGGKIKIRLQVAQD